MASITAPNVETQEVVSGTDYFLSISESDSGTGITRIEFGPYHFEGPPGQIRYPEAPTNEMCPGGWQQIHWVQDLDGSSWLRYEGGIIVAKDGELFFQFTSNFPPSSEGPAKLRIWRGPLPESFDVKVPDYTQQPPVRNSRRDTTGLGAVYHKWGCLPQVILCITAIVGVLVCLK